MKFWEVGGCIRDELMGLKSKDVDFAVDLSDELNTDNFTVDEAFLHLRDSLELRGFELFEVTPEFGTIRAKVPMGHELETRTKVADFVLCRVEGPYSDNRHPDWVKVGDIWDDLARRDFTMNAIARSVDGSEILDPHDGIEDINNKILRFVGDPMQRIREDGRRVVRAFRFVVTKDVEMHSDTWDAISTEFAAECVANARSRETLRDEMEKCFKVDSLRTMQFLHRLPMIEDAIFGLGDIRLSATMKK